MIFLSKYKPVFIYGIALALLLFLLNWLKIKFIIIDHAFEVYALGIAAIFMTLGIWLAIKLTKPKIQTVTIEKEVYIKSGQSFVFNENEFEKLGLSKREMEVLNLMAKGLSNKEIGEQLFVSLNTIKTHTSKIFEKLEVNRRTQAIEKAKRLNLIE